MIWIAGLLAIVALWLVLRTKQTRTQRIVNKYEARQRQRNKPQISLMPQDNTVATEEEREILREEYARQKDQVEQIDRRCINEG